MTLWKEGHVLTANLIDHTSRSKVAVHGWLLRRIGSCHGMCVHKSGIEKTSQQLHNLRILAQVSPIMIDLFDGEQRHIQSQLLFFHCRPQLQALPARQKQSTKLSILRNTILDRVSVRIGPDSVVRSCLDFWRRWIGTSSLRIYHSTSIAS